MTELEKKEINTGRLLDTEEKPDIGLTDPGAVEEGNHELPRMLTQSELESLRQDMTTSSEWAAAELKKRKSRPAGFTDEAESSDQ